MLIILCSFRMAEEAIDLSRHFESEGETDLIIAEDDEEEPELADDDDVCQEMLVPIVEITEDTVCFVVNYCFVCLHRYSEII